MQHIRLHRLDKPLPDSLRFDFSNNQRPVAGNVPGDLMFRKFPVPFEEYSKAFALVMEELRAGNSFLVNLTMPTPIETNHSLSEIYERSTARYKLWVRDKFVCFSPEPFIRIHKGTISTFPMKGTIDGKLTHAEEKILSDKKETAEHNTVVDLLRNDLSRVSGKVEVARYRYIERIRGNEGEILQVSSEITGQLEEDYSEKIGDILFSLLPAGSVTGAPKPMTIKIIQKAEKNERGYYAGICGVFNGRELDSAVMIRFIEIREGKMYFRSGGGITYMSQVADEYEEMIRKVYVPLA